MTDEKKQPSVVKEQVIVSADVERETVSQNQLAISPELLSLVEKEKAQEQVEAGLATAHPSWYELTHLDFDRRELLDVITDNRRDYIENHNASVIAGDVQENFLAVNPRFFEQPVLMEEQLSAQLQGDSLSSQLRMALKDDINSDATPFNFSSSPLFIRVNNGLLVIETVDPNADKILYSTLGIDTLIGGGGNDTFVWTSALGSGVGAGNRDVVPNFRRGSSSSNPFNAAESDKIDLTALGLDFRGSGIFFGTGNEVRWAVEGGNTIIKIDFDGDTTEDMEIELTGLTQLQTDHFIGLNNIASADLTLAPTDNISLGNGYNTYRVGANTLTVGSDTISGGTGNDTLAILDGQTIDLTGVSQITSIERIDLGDGAYDNQLNMGVADLVAITPGANRIYIDGDSGDTLQFGNPGNWVVQNGSTPVTVGATDYYYFFNAGNGFSLYFDADISHNLTV